MVRRDWCGCQYIQGNDHIKTISIQFPMAVLLSLPIHLYIAFYQVIILSLKHQKTKYSIYRIHLVDSLQK